MIKNKSLNILYCMVIQILLVIGLNRGVLFGLGLLLVCMIGVLRIHLWCLILESVFMVTSANQCFIESRRVGLWRGLESITKKCCCGSDALQIEYWVVVSL